MLFFPAVGSGMSSRIRTSPVCLTDVVENKPLVVSLQWLLYGPPSPPITDLASSPFSLGCVCYGSLRLSRPPFCPLTWHALSLKNLLIGASPRSAVNRKRLPSIRQPEPMLPVCQ